MSKQLLNPKGFRVWGSTYIDSSFHFFSTTPHIIPTYPEAVRRFGRAKTGLIGRIEFINKQGWVLVASFLIFHLEDLIWGMRREA